MRKHGGEKGVPFRIQIDTFKENENEEYTEHLHSASCQVKVFKVRGTRRHIDALQCKHFLLITPPKWPPCDMFQPKGADRKQKTDREKMEKRAPQEKEKYQPSYETTILTEVSMLLMCQRMDIKLWDGSCRCLQDTCRLIFLSCPLLNK